jgi:tryptophan halogenase
VTQAPTLQRVVIVGGGLEGWTAAAGIANSLRGSGTEISVVEVPGLVNVEPAQYLLPETLLFLRRLGIDENELVRQTGATFRLGTELTGLLNDADRQVRPFGAVGANIGFVLFHHFVTNLRTSEDSVEYADFSPNVVAARNDRFTRPSEQDRIPELSYGLNLNTDKLIKLLRTNATINGVTCVDGQPTGVRQQAESGAIEALELKDAQRIDGDFFIDCTGEAAVLLGDSLGVPYVDWSHWLPCDRRVSVTTKGKPAAPPLLRCTAVDEGWVVQAALQYRTAHQLLYSSVCTDDESASNSLVRFVGDASADALAFGESKNGHRRQFWAKNCVALGTSAGRVEPLDVGDFHLAQSGVTRLMTLFPSGRIEAPLAEEYNRATRDEYECLRDYVLLNYLASDWRDTLFWRRSRGADTVPSLRRRTDLFRSRGRVSLGEHETYSRDAWISAFLVAGLQPEGYDPMLDAMDTDELRRHFGAMRAAIEQAVETMPSHAEYMANLLA